MVKPSDSDSNSNSKYKGVRKRKWGKWVSEIRLPNSRERIWLGSYDTPEKAARAFDAALFCLRGHSATFNFPHQPPDIPGGRSLPPSQIQAAAARFASNHSFSSDSPSTTTASSNSSQDSPSPSVHQHQHQDQDQDQGESSWTFPFLQDLDSMSMSMSMSMNMNMNIVGESMSVDGGVPDYGIYPGFDDYFMTTPPPPEEEEEEDGSYCDGIYLQSTGTGPSFLWNF